MISSVVTDSGLRGDQHKTIAGFVDEYSKKSVVKLVGVTEIPATVNGACGAGFPRDERSTARPKFGGSVML
jgi:type IV pilus biogenesis protein CpaD/CtpE